MRASRFLKYTGRNWPNPVCSFYLPVSTSRDATVDDIFAILEGGQEKAQRQKKE